MDYIHMDYAPVDDCKHPEWTYGEICVKCNECGRFNVKQEPRPASGTEKEDKA